MVFELEVLLIFFLPVALQIYRKYSWLIVMLFLLPGSFLIEKHVHLTKYLFIVPLAICFADQQVFERLKSWKPLKSQALSKFLKFVVSTGMILALLMLWNSRWALERFEFMLNGLIPVCNHLLGLRIFAGYSRTSSVAGISWKILSNSILYPYLYKNIMAERFYLFTWTCSSDLAVPDGKQYSDCGIS